MPNPKADRENCVGRGKKDSSAKFLFFTLGMDSDPRLVVFFIILSTNPKMLQILVYLLLTRVLSGES